MLGPSLTASTVLKNRDGALVTLVYVLGTALWACLLFACSKQQRRLAFVCVWLNAGFATAVVVWGWVSARGSW